MFVIFFLQTKTTTTKTTTKQSKQTKSLENISDSKFIVNVILSTIKHLTELSTSLMFELEYIFAYHSSFGIKMEFFLFKRQKIAMSAKPLYCIKLGFATVLYSRY